MPSPTSPIIPADESAMREQIMQAMRVDPSGMTLAALFCAQIALARAEASEAAVLAATRSLAKVYDRKGIWSAPK